MLKKKAIADIYKAYKHKYSLRIQYNKQKIILELVQVLKI